VQVPVYEPVNQLGPASSPASLASSAGIPKEIITLTLVVPFNNPATAERSSTSTPGGSPA
jgi:glutamate-1-semialdehyde aminotransferase